MPKVYFCSKVICDVSNDEEAYEGLEPCEDYTHYPWDGNFFVIVPDDILQIYDEDSIDIYLAERLSDETGYCIQTFKFEECDEDETARVLAADEEYDEAELLKQDNEDLQRIMDMTLPYRHKEWDDLLYLYYLKNIHGKDIEAIDIKLALKVAGSLFIDDAVDDDWEADPEMLVVEVTGGTKWAWYYFFETVQDAFKKQLESWYERENFYTKDLGGFNDTVKDNFNKFKALLN